MSIVADIKRERPSMRITWLPTDAASSRGADRAKAWQEWMNAAELGQESDDDQRQRDHDLRNVTGSC